MDKPMFKGKVLVVTGGASGIGLAVCRRFGLAGAKIAMIDMDATALEGAKKEFKKRQIPFIGLQCDVTRQEDVFHSVEQIIRHFNHIDILFNNAGITQRGLFSKTRIEVIKKVMDVNFYGSLYCTKAALDSLIEQKGAIIVNESIAGIAPLIGRTGYSASKHALHGLFTSLRCELRSKGVHVMVVCPGFIKTNLQKRALGADGNIATHAQTKVGSEDTVEHVADQIFNGLIKRKSNLVLTFFGKLSYYIHRLTPLLYEKLMTRQLREELDN